MILQLTAKSTEVQNLIRTNTHIPHCYATERANKKRTLQLILKLDLITSDCRCCGHKTEKRVVTRSQVAG